MKYLTAALAFLSSIVGLLFYRERSKREKDKRKQAEAKAKAMTEAYKVEKTVDNLSDSAKRDRLSDFNRD